MSRTEALWKTACRFCKGAGMKANGNESYIAGLKRYRDKGIAIRIDGEECEERDWSRIFEAREDQSFYMADFVSNEDTGKLMEIRFDRVYHK